MACPADDERADAGCRVKGYRRGGQYILSNTSHGFDHWLNSYKHQLAQELQREMLLAFPEVFAGLRNGELIRETVQTLLWPEMEPLLRDRAEELLLTYAVRGIALSWASRHLGDNLLVGVPVKRNPG